MSIRQYKYRGSQQVGGADIAVKVRKVCETGGGVNADIRV
jgi:hypothetical protein